MCVRVDPFICPTDIGCLPAVAYQAVILALLLAGCSSGLVLTPFTTQETERAACLKAGAVWVESQTRYGCYAPGERT